MNFNKTIAYKLSELKTVTRELSHLLRDKCMVMTFTGPLGAGKTTLIQSLLRAHGIREPVTSPTFNYVNQYEDQSGRIFNHFDLYRVGSMQNFVDAGFTEYLYQPRTWALIEWPAIINPLLDKDVCHITIDYGSHEDERILKIDCV